MNKVSVFCLLVSLFAFGSCHEDEETEFENKVYTNFPDVFDVPAEGGKFLIKQTYKTIISFPIARRQLIMWIAMGKSRFLMTAYKATTLPLSMEMVRFILIQIVFTTVGLS